MADLPDKISPLHDLVMPRVAKESAGVILSERVCDSLVQVQAWPETVDKVEATVKALGGDCVVMSTGPGRWLIEDDEDGLESGLRKKISTKLGAVTDLTHGRVVVTVEGQKTEWVLASGIALDFSLTAFPIGTTQLSHHHEIGLTIHRTAENRFDLYVFTSLARAFWQWLERASAEVGYGVT